MDNEFKCDLARCDKEWQRMVDMPPLLRFHSNESQKIQAFLKWQLYFHLNEEQMDLIEEEYDLERGWRKVCRGKIKYSLFVTAVKEFSQIKV